MRGLILGVVCLQSVTNFRIREGYFPLRAFSEVLIESNKQSRKRILWVSTRIDFKIWLSNMNQHLTVGSQLDACPIV